MWKHTEEVKRRMSEAKKGSKNPAWGKPGTNLGKKFSLEHCRHISEACRGRVSPNLGKKLSVKHRLSLSKAQQGKKASAETRAKISKSHRISLKSQTQIQARLRIFCSKLELFVKNRLQAHGGHQFIHQGHIPGFVKLAGRAHPWDFLIPEKKLAVEIDGRYWHSTDNPNGWDVVKELENEEYARQLGWYVVRLPEVVLRRSKPFQAWRRRQ